MTRQLRFIHAADIHLDSPLDQLRQLDATTANRLQLASRRSVELIVQTALDQSVDAVLIAGDLFDGPVKDAGGGLWVESQFKRLSRSGIPVILIRGNHDAQSNARHVVHWRSDIRLLETEQAESVVLEQCGLAVHGQSFGARAESTDMALQYPSPVSGYFNVGLLHTSLAGSNAHDVYAPTSVATLESKGYDYWGLGHIHLRSPESLSPRCFIGYSGNTQGRHIRESGAKGFSLVTVCDGKLASVEFQPSDSVRWYQITVDLSGLELLSEIEDRLPDLLEPLVSQAGGRPLAVRIQLTGATSMHGDLAALGMLDRLYDSWTVRLSEVGEVWLEKIQLRTSAPRAAMVAELDLPMKYLSQVASELTHDQEPQPELLALLEELLKKSRSDLQAAGSSLVNEGVRPAELQRLIQSAQDLILSRLQIESK